MTNAEITGATPANAPSLPDYLHDVQSRAMRLSGVIQALSLLNFEGRCPDGEAALIGVADDLARGLNEALDSANLPKGAVS